MRIRGAVCALVLVTLTPACTQVDNEAHTDSIRTIAAGEPGWVDRTPLGRRLWGMEREFYAARGYAPAWIDGDRTTPHLKELVQEFRYSERHGLDPSTYPADEYERFRAASQTWRGTRFDPAAVPDLDARLTYGYLRYAAELLGWTGSPSKISRSWLTKPRNEDLTALLSETLRTGRVRESLEGLAPNHPQYKGLQSALAREREHPTGHAERIRMNLERWRWAPRDLGERYILVNVPAYILQVMEGPTPTLAMRVIVGQPDWQTPLFSDDMTYLVFSPYWNIPENILREETLPRAARDPEFLARNNIEVVGTSGSLDPESIDWSDPSVTSELRLRQLPGPDNALGLVKFIFPNHFNIYLHDTPGDRLFFRRARALSHGCIRVENPVALARYVLRDQPDWTEPRIVSAMNAGTERAVKLERPLPVHIGYWTAWVEPDGSVTFTDDPYDIDAAHARLLKPIRQVPTVHQTS